MKVNYIVYLNPYYKSIVGGGEYINRHFIETGSKLGIDIKIGYRESNLLDRLITPKAKIHNNPDFWILCDIFNIPSHHLSFKKGFIESVIEHEKFIHWDNSYVDICSQSAFPCNGTFDCQCIKNNNSHFIDRMYNKSLLNIFLSPLHLLLVNKRFGNSILDKNFIARPFIDTQLFINREMKRDIEYIYVGSISDYKGYENLKIMFGHCPEKIFLVGKKGIKGKLFTSNHIEQITHEELVTYYNRAKTFVHLPVWKEPMARTVCEAALCGCELLLNDNVGAKYFNADLSNPNFYLNAAEETWETIINKVLHNA